MKKIEIGTIFALCLYIWHLSLGIKIISKRERKMKMKKLVSAIGVFSMVSFIAGSVMAEGQPSAKFAATWSTTPGLESAVISRP